MARSRCHGLPAFLVVRWVGRSIIRTFLALGVNDNRTSVLLVGVIPSIVQVFDCHRTSFFWLNTLGFRRVWICYQVQLKVHVDYLKGVALPPTRWNFRFVFVNFRLTWKFSGNSDGGVRLGRFFMSIGVENTLEEGLEADLWVEQKYCL